MNKYAFFDVDQTLFNGYSNNEILIFLVKQELISKNYLKRLNKYTKAYSETKIDYEVASRLIAELLAEVVRGKNIDTVGEWGRLFLEEKNLIYPWVKPLMHLLDQKGVNTYLISGTITPIVKIIADYLETDKYFASPVPVKNEKYSGIIEYILNFEEKQKLVHRIIGHLPEDRFMIGVGDSTGDVAMLSVVDRAFVIHPHQKEMLDIAKINNWKITDDEHIINDVVKVI